MRWLLRFFFASFLSFTFSGYFWLVRQYILGNNKMAVNLVIVHHFSDIIIQFMKALLIVILSICSFTAVSAQDTDKIKELELKVKMLEERVARLERIKTDVEPSRHTKKMMEIAKKHSNQEREKFKADDIAKAEVLYQKGNKMLADERSKKPLDSIVSLYPQLNRAGCAQLYRAQQETGTEKERLLKDCIERFSNCYYGDGAQVGPLAMFQLAYYYRYMSKEAEAEKLFKQLRQQYRGAIGHDGEKLLSKVE